MNHGVIEKHLVLRGCSKTCPVLDTGCSDARRAVKLELQSRSKLEFVS